VRDHRAWTAAGEGAVARGRCFSPDPTRPHPTRLGPVRSWGVAWRAVPRSRSG
jgi:hypothetical protein